MAESFRLFFNANFTLGLDLASGSLDLGVDFFHAVDKESWPEVINIALREGGVLTTLWTGEWLVQACLQGMAVDTLLAVVVIAGKNFRIIVVLMTDRAGDLLFQILETRILTLSHFY